MASLQLKEPIRESLPMANCQHDEHTTAQKHQEADAKRLKRVVAMKSDKHLTEFYSHESESLQHGKQTIATRKTKERGKKEASKELYAATYDSSNMVALKPMKAEHKIKEEKKNKKKEEKKKKKKEKKSKSKIKDDSSSSSSSFESEDDVCSKKV